MAEATIATKVESAPAAHLVLMKQLTQQIDIAIGAVAANSVEPFLASVSAQQLLVQSLAASGPCFAETVDVVGWQQVSSALLSRSALYAAVLAQASRTARLLGDVSARGAARDCLSAHG